MKNLLILFTFTLLFSCNKEDDCKCNKYLKTSNGNLIPDGEVSMQNCEGANPTPLLVTYKKECN